MTPPTENDAPVVRWSCPCCGWVALRRADAVASWCHWCRAAMARSIPPAPILAAGRDATGT